ncbi:hypothetical protein [Kordia jejudonensis]|uniref:hypothetical protein n=1 Tax=Kordia jejudonensis TaxID=1348245 RepID=UPI00062903AC|nr:hypothetical protein [Kordia jejudonensis]
MRVKYLYSLEVLLLCMLFSAVSFGQSGAIFDFFDQRGYRIDQGFANVTSQGVLGDGIRYRKDNSIVYLFNDGRNGIAFEGDLTAPDIMEFMERYEKGINSAPELLASTRASFASINRIVNNIVPPNDIDIIKAKPLLMGGAFDFKVEVEVDVFTNVFSGLSRPGAELNLDAAGQPVNPTFFIAGQTAKLGFLMYDWEGDIRFPTIQDVNSNIPDLSIVLSKIPGLNENLDIIESIDGNLSQASLDSNFPTKLQLLMNEVRQEQGYGSKKVKITSEGRAFVVPSAFFDNFSGKLKSTKIDDFIEQVGIQTAKGTSTNPQTKVKSTTKGPAGNSKGGENYTNSGVDSFKYAGVEVTREDAGGGTDRWTYNGFSTGRLDDRIDQWDDYSAGLHAQWLTIDYNELDAQVDSLNARLFNGEDLPLGLGVSSNPNIKFAPVTLEYIVNVSTVNGIEIEALSKEINRNHFIGNNANNGGDNNGDNGDDGDGLPIDNGPGNNFDDGPGGGSGDGGACICTDFGCSCSSKSNSNENFSVPNVIITNNFIKNSDFLSILTENFGLGDKKLIQKLFIQALTLPNEKQGMLLNDSQISVEQAELYHITYKAAIAFKQELLNHLNSKIETLNTTTVWMESLKNKDEQLYATILNKLTAFYEKESGIKDGTVFITPKFKFELSITPKVPIINYEGEDALALNAMKYDIDIVLTSARLALGVDTDEDFKADLGVVLNETELQFILDTWAQDTNGDKFIDQGYIVWLQQQLFKVKQHLSEEIKAGTTKAFKAYNQMVLPLAVADFCKRQLLEDNVFGKDPANLGALVDKNTLGVSNLLALDSISYSAHNSISSEYVFSIQTEKGKDIVFNPYSIITKLNPIKLFGKENNRTGVAKQQGSSGGLAATLNFSNDGFSLKQDTLVLGLQSEGKIKLQNISNQTISAGTYIITSSTSEEVLYLDVAKFDVPEIPIGGSINLFFDYTPIAADSKSQNMEDFRLHKVGDFNNVIVRRDFYIEENIMAGIDFTSFCEESQASYSTINDNATLAGQRVVTGNIIETGANFTVKAIETIDLTIGFEAKLGAKVDFSIVDCNTLQNAVINGMINSMQP